MAAIDPYAPCPCGSGQKFKWCCQGVEPVADRAHRLFEGNQIEAAFQALDEGLKKTPDNPWLLTRKALYELRRGRFEAAKPLLERVIAKQPAHVGAGGLLLRVILETEGPIAGVKVLQRMLSAVPIEALPSMAVLAQIVGMMLGETGHAPAAIEHLTLALELMPGDDELAENSLRSVLSNPSTSPWLRNIYELSPAPDGLAPPLVDRFEKAIDKARRGQWTEAASGFESLSADRVPVADRNLGLCRLWLADNGPAAQALRRYIASAGETEEAVDLEALCQLVAPPKEEDLVEQVQLTWTLRNRGALLAALRADASIDDEGTSSADPDDPESPEEDTFALLDRPRPAGDALPATADLVPKIVGRAIVEQDTLALETFDDGRLDKLTKRLVAIAGSSIPPAHPKTKVLGSVPRASLAMQAEWWTPENVDRKALAALYATERVRLVREVWTSTPMPYLKGRTPLQAAKSGDAKVPLRAAVCMLELAHEFHREGIDFAALRADLNIPPEPEIDPETVDIAEVHLARLHRVPADRLDDDKLIQLFDRAHGNVLPLALERSATALSERPSALRREGVGAYIVFADLANLALSRGAIADAFEFARRGRAADPIAVVNAIRWEMMELRLRARTEAPEAWVPTLAVLLERFSEDRESSSAILSNLMDMGLIQMVPNPDRPEEMLLDTRRLQAVLARFGPKITTSSGRLGVSATTGGIWTPGSQAGGSTGGLWTPGSGPPPATSGEKPKLIIPGR